MRFRLIQNVIALQNHDEFDRCNTFVTNDLNMARFHFDNFCEGVTIDDREALLLQAERKIAFPAFAVHKLATGPSFVRDDLEIIVHLLV